MNNCLTIISCAYHCQANGVNHYLFCKEKKSIIIFIVYQFLETQSQLVLSSFFMLTNKIVTCVNNWVSKLPMHVNTYWKPALVYLSSKQLFKVIFFKFKTIIFSQNQIWIIIFCFCFVLFCFVLFCFFKLMNLDVSLLAC